MLGQLLDAGLALCEPPSACMEIRAWNLILFVSISRSAHTTFLGSLEWNQGCFSQSRFSHYPGMAQAPFMCCFSKGFCVPPWRASFPSLSKVEFPDGNPNYKHMVLLSATTLLAKGKKNRKPFSLFLEYIFCQGAVSVDRKVIVKHILGADLHAKHKFEPGSHVRQLLHQQNSVLWLNVMVTGFESQRCVGLLNASTAVETIKSIP